MRTFKDYYAILQVHPKAKPSVIKAAWRQLAREYHPDVYKESDAHQRMVELNEAYEVIGKPSSRASYDLECASREARTRQQAADSQAKAGGPTASPSAPSEAQRKREEEQRAAEARARAEAQRKWEEEQRADDARARAEAQRKQEEEQRAADARARAEAQRKWEEEQRAADARARAEAQRRREEQQRASDPRAKPGDQAAKDILADGEGGQQQKYSLVTLIFVALLLAAYTIVSLAVDANLLFYLSRIVLGMGIIFVLCVILFLVVASVWDRTAKSVHIALVCTSLAIIGAAITDYTVAYLLNRSAFSTVLCQLYLALGYVGIPLAVITVASCLDRLVVGSKLRLNGKRRSPANR